MVHFQRKTEVPGWPQKDKSIVWSKESPFSSPLTSNRINIILQVVGSNMWAYILVKVRVLKDVPGGPQRAVFLFGTKNWKVDIKCCIKFSVYWVFNSVTTSLLSLQNQSLKDIPCLRLLLYVCTTQRQN